MFLVRGSKLTLVLCAGRKKNISSVNMENGFVYLMVDIDLVSVRGIELELISV